MKIIIYSTYHFLLEPSTCPPTPILINHIFSWKSKIKHTDVDPTCFFQDIKSSPTKHKKCFLEASYGTSQTSKVELCRKKVNIYSQNQFSMFERYLNNTNSYFDESYSSQLLTHPLNLIIWCKIRAFSLIALSSTLQLSYRE